MNEPTRNAPRLELGGVWLVTGLWTMAMGMTLAVWLT